MENCVLDFKIADLKNFDINDIYNKEGWIIEQYR
jgi:hypothetical protein